MARYTGFSDRGPDSPTSVYTDSSVAAGNCYMYRYVVTDRVGNQHIATSASVSKIDYGGAVDDTTGILSHWRLGEARHAHLDRHVHTDTTGALITAHAGEIGPHLDLPDGHRQRDVHRATGSTLDGARLRAGRSIYTTPYAASPDYAVEADLYVKSNLAGDMSGVIGRDATRPTADLLHGPLRAGRPAAGTWSSTHGTTPTSLATSTTPGLTVGQTYNVRLEMTGTTSTTLRLFVNDVLRRRATDACADHRRRRRGDHGGRVRRAYGTPRAPQRAAPRQLQGHGNLPRAADSKGTNHAAYVNGPTAASPAP